MLYRAREKDTFLSSSNTGIINPYSISMIHKLTYLK